MGSGLPPHFPTAPVAAGAASLRVFMPPYLHPPQMLDASIEGHLTRISAPTRAIYLVLLFTLAAAAAALPLFQVEVVVRSRGLLRPSVEKHPVHAQATGVVAEVRVRDGRGVRAGDTLLVLEQGALGEQARRVAGALTEQRGRIRDLELLVGQPATPPIEPGRITSPALGQEYLEFTLRLREHQARRGAAERERGRARMLYERDLISQAAWEEQEDRWAQLAGGQELLVREQLRAWQTALAAARAQLREHQAEEALVRQENRLRAVTSPVSGTVEQLASVSPGSSLRAGEQLAVVSPVAPLTAEMYVEPSDIGLLRLGAPVRLQLDAFPYTDWGFATGRVTEISDDFLPVDGQPMFRVRASVEQQFLQLRNGYRGRLRKGMTLVARFRVAERSLLQLLVDDVNDWLDPAQARR